MRVILVRPTGPQRARKITQVVTFLAALQFTLSGVESFLHTDVLMGTLWLGGAVAAAAATMHTERFFQDERRIRGP